MSDETGWPALKSELDAWADGGRTATFWWRDDDAVADTPALRRMVSLSASFDVPLGIAVIPAKLEASLAPALDAVSGVEVLLHGYAHANHEPVGEKKAEIGVNRPASDSIDDLRSGWRVLRDSFHRQALPVLVPPWNRVHPDIAAALPTALDQPVVGLSTFKPRSAPTLAGRVRIANTHCDPIDWKGMKSGRAGSAFLGTEASLGQIITHLQGKRMGAVDAEEPTGILTHHLVEPESCTDFMRSLFDTINGHPAAAWMAPSAVFGIAASPLLRSVHHD